MSPRTLQLAGLWRFAAVLVVCTACLVGCDAALPDPDPGRFEAVVTGDLAARLSGRAVLAPATFSHSTTPPRRHAVHPIHLITDWDTLRGLGVSIAYLFPGEEPAPEIPEGTFEIASGDGETPLASVGVSTRGGSLLLNQGRVTIRRVGGGVRGTVEGSGSSISFSGRRISASVRASFFALPDPASVTRSR